MGLGNRKTIGFYIDWPESSTYHRSLLSGAHEEALKNDLNLLVICAGNLASEAQYDPSFVAAYEYVESGEIDAVVLVAETLSPVVGTSRILEKIARWPSLPIVSIGGGFTGIPNVNIKNNDNYAQLMDHLFNVHHYKDPVFVSGPKDSIDSNNRKAIFIDKARQYGIEVKDRHIYHGRFNLIDGEEAARTFWDERKMKPDVVVCANDNMAFGLIYALNRRGIRVPEDVAITGFDDLPFSEFCSSPLSTIRQPLQEEGAMAVRLAHHLLQGKSMPIELETQLVIRNSCGCSFRHSDGNFAVASHQQEVLHHTIKDNEDVFLSNLLANFEIFYHSAGKILSHERFESEFLTYLNIDSFYLTQTSSSSRKLPKTSQLMIAWNDKKKIEIPEEGISFNTLEVVPENMFGDQRWTNMLFTLTDGEGCFGTLVFNYSPEVKARYIGVRSRFSSFLSLMRSNVKLKQLYSKLKEASQKLEELSLTDEMTNHYNRRGFMLHATRQVAYCRRNDEGFWVFFIDLDGLKKINDTWGHEDGDCAIRSFAEVIRKAVRETDIVARLGGDEFTVMVTHSAPETMTILRSRLRQFLQEKNDELKKPWTLSFSMGGALSASDDRTSLELLMQQADRNLYEEKNSKKKELT